MELTRSKIMELKLRKRFVNGNGTKIERRNNMVKLMKNYEAYIYNMHTGEVRKLSHFTKNHIKNQITEILTYPFGEFYEHKTRLGDENDVNFEIHFYNEIGEKIKPDFTTKDLNVYMKELSKHLTK